MWSDNGEGNYCWAQQPLVRNYIIDWPDAGSWQARGGAQKIERKRNSTRKINSLSVWHRWVEWKTYPQLSSFPLRGTSAGMWACAEPKGSLWRQISGWLLSQMWPNIDRDDARAVSTMQRVRQDFRTHKIWFAACGFYKTTLNLTALLSFSGS